MSVIFNNGLKNVPAHVRLNSLVIAWFLELPSGDNVVHNSVLDCDWTKPFPSRHWMAWTQDRQVKQKCSRGTISSSFDPRSGGCRDGTRLLLFLDHFRSFTFGPRNPSSSPISIPIPWQLVYIISAYASSFQISISNFELYWYVTPPTLPKFGRFWRARRTEQYVISLCSFWFINEKQKFILMETWLSWSTSISLSVSSTRICHNVHHSLSQALLISLKLAPFLPKSYRATPHGFLEHYCRSPSLWWI